MFGKALDNSSRTSCHDTWKRCNSQSNDEIKNALTRNMENYLKFSSSNSYEWKKAITFYMINFKVLQRFAVYAVNHAMTFLGIRNSEIQPKDDMKNEKNEILKISLWNLIW